MHQTHKAKETHTLAAKQILKYLLANFIVCSLSSLLNADTTSGLAWDAGIFPTKQPN
jgi:hypothetical protein